MPSYPLLNLAVMLVVLVITYRLWQQWRRLGICLAVMLVLTALFDPVIIGLDIVRYHEATLWGAKLAGAPLEDFAYAVVAAVAMPALWQRLYRSHS